MDTMKIVTQEPVKLVMKKDVLIAQVQPNVLNVTQPFHITYFQEIVMKSVHLELLLMTKTVLIVVILVKNVMDQIQTIVTFVKLNTSTETHVSTHALMENGQIQTPRLVTTVMKPVKLVQLVVKPIVKLVTPLMTYGREKI